MQRGEVEVRAQRENGGGPKGRYKKYLNLNLQKTELQDCWNGKACNLQIDRACSLQELELQMSVLSREKKCRITV